MKAATSQELSVEIREKFRVFIVELFKQFEAAIFAKKENSASEEQSSLLEEFEIYKSKKDYVKREIELIYGKNKDTIENFILTIAKNVLVERDAEIKEAAKSQESRAKVKKKIAELPVKLFEQFAAAKLANKLNSATKEQMLILKQFERYLSYKKFEPTIKRRMERKIELGDDSDEYIKSNPFNKERTRSLPSPARLPPPSSKPPPNGGKSITRRYKRRKTLRRKTLRRKTLRRKTLRRKTLRRKKYYKN
jgi:hypothetical protein